MHGFIMAYIEFPDTAQNSLPHWSKYLPATRGFQEKFHTQPLKSAKAEPNFRMVNLPPAKLYTLFLTQL